MKIVAKQDFKKIVALKGYNIAMLARESGMTLDALSKISLHKNGIHPRNAKNVADALGMGIEDLFIIED